MRVFLFLIKESIFCSDLISYGIHAHEGARHLDISVHRDICVSHGKSICGSGKVAQHNCKVWLGVRFFNTNRS